MANDVGTNWAGNLAYGATVLHEPSSVEEVRRMVATASSIRALGSRHSFNTIADGTSELLSTAALTGPVTINRDRSTVTVGAGIRYGELARELERAGFALANLASLPHISVGGAVATGTHGSGNRNRSLAAAVVGLELVTGSGDLIAFDAGNPDLAGAVINLGALGVVTSLELEIEPAFEVEQTVFEQLPLDALTTNFDGVTGAAYSVSVFTTWRNPDAADSVWVKRRPDRDVPLAHTLFGAVRATEERHPLPGLPAIGCTPQLGAAGPWYNRLPHFKLDFTPSNGVELQSEYLVPRQHAVDAILAVRELSAEIAPLLQVNEIRTVAADELWLSSSYGTDAVGLHFTWVQDQPAVEAFLPTLEAALEPFAARPHWGKLFTLGAHDLDRLYPRLEDFRLLVKRMDPDGVFDNPFTAEVLGR
ncbi:FAD-binding protein [Arthrobacter sp. JZ12]|uniref:D-arabinono-1,4-lactone oxidase n=1 Tax=Arthrobacter sp. JZ12 TaxID=2654190 RepID=UPI002B495CAA|nr:D-arabinono-1,4-lactone oxidase [Arthrobacter sp. JZ12]WRH23879.1 FAD-binding protein [Arthrobacter sp. JZ12]